MSEPESLCTTQTNLAPKHNPEIKAKRSFSNSSLGKLPQELRDEIYKHYFTVRGGYLIDPVTNSLRSSDGIPIDLSLRLVCHAIAKETEGLALQCNTIHAATTKDQRFANTAYRLWSDNKSFLWEHHANLLDNTECITPDMAEEILDGYPQYRKVLEEMIANPSGLLHMRRSHTVATEAFSTERKFASHVLKVITDRVGVENLHSNTRIRMSQGTCPDCGQTQEDARWTIPIDCLSTALDTCNTCNDSRAERQVFTGGMVIGNHAQCSFSATAVAIRFWNAFDPAARKHIQLLDIHEDNRSSGTPASHAEGLIPTWRDNPKLRINRRINIWNTILEEARDPEVPSCHFPRFNHGDVLKTLWDWIAEVKVLQASDIPENAFTVTFCCDSTPENNKEMIDAVKEAAAWQIALKTAAETGTASGIYDSDYLLHLWDPRGLAWQTLQDISSGSPGIKCDFDVGQPVDPKELYDGVGCWPHEKWSKHHDRSIPKNWVRT